MPDPLDMKAVVIRANEEMLLRRRVRLDVAVEEVFASLLREGMQGISVVNAQATIRAAIIRSGILHV